MYHLALAFGLCFVYVGVAYGLAWFFEGRSARLPAARAARSMGIIVLVALAANIASAQITDWQTANRVLHLFGGGFAGYLVCVLAARDVGLSIGRTRFITTAVLLVTLLGVLNEHVELILQSFFHLRFAAGPFDTWLDLASNSAGIILGAALLTPLVGRYTTATHVNKAIAR